jgi:hypothetical protein
MIDLGALQWSAGFFEGEGCVRLNKGRPGSPITMGFQIINTDLEALERFRRGVCGLGDIHGPYKGQTERHKPTWTWCSNRFKDVNALKGLLFPLLSSRRQQQILDAHEVASTQRAGRWPNGKQSTRDTVVRAVAL